MKRLKNSLLAAVIAMFVFVGAGITLDSPAAAAPEKKQTRVTYAPIPAGTYKLDPAHSKIGFSVKHLEIALVDGRFKDFDGTIEYDDKNVERSTVRFTAKVASIDTEVEARDNHLRSADFFDAANFPEMNFVSTKIERRAKNSFTMTGDLTIRGVTKQVTLPFSITGAVPDPWGGTRFGIAAGTTINRKDFGVNYQNPLPFGGFDVASDVTISLSLEAVKSEPKPAAQ